MAFLSHAFVAVVVVLLAVALASGTPHCANKDRMEVPGLELMQVGHRLSHLIPGRITGETGVSLLAFGQGEETMEAPANEAKSKAKDEKSEAKDEKSEAKEEKSGATEETNTEPAKESTTEASAEKEENAEEEGENSNNASANATSNTTNETKGTNCTTRQDDRVQAFFTITSPPGTPCVFGVIGDARDEGSHCIYDGGMFGSNGWCYTSKDRSSWGSCNEHCPLWGSAEQIGKKIEKVAKVVAEVVKLVNATPPAAGAEKDASSKKGDGKHDDKKGHKKEAKKE